MKTFVILCPIASNGGVETHIGYLLKQLSINDVILITRFFNCETNLAKYCREQNISVKEINGKISFLIYLVHLRMKKIGKSITFYTTEISYQSLIFSWVLYSRKTILNPVGNPKNVANQLNRFSSWFRKSVVIVESEVHMGLIKNKNCEILAHISNVNGYSIKNRVLIPGQATFGFLSWLHPNKRPIDVAMAFVKVYSKFPNSKIIFLDDGEQFSKIKDIFISNNIIDSVKFIHPWKNIDQLKEIHDSIDILIFFSKSEGLPLTLIEACANGTPFISTNVGAVSTLTKYSPNSVIIKDSSKDLIHEMTRLLNQGGEVSPLRENLINEFNNKFGNSELTKKYLSLIL